ncbi:MAG: hypothetical protein R3E96_12885 [Planctomycetota bacterium]
MTRGTIWTLGILLFVCAPWAWAGGEIPSKVKNDLLSRYEKDRAGAVRKLAEIGGDEAWGLVIKALADSKGQVADEAQKQLAAESCPAEVRKRLLDEGGLGSKDEWVQLRAAEVLGLAPEPVDGLAVGEVLNKKKPLVSVAALRCLADRGARGGLDWGKGGERNQARIAKQVAGLVGAGGEMAAEALLALAELDRPRAVELADKGVKSGDALVRAAGWLVLERAEAPGLVGRLAAALEDSDGAVRGVAHRILQRAGTREALGMLIGALEKEPREKLLLELVPRLQAMTGYKAGRSAEAWRNFERDLPDDWHAAAAVDPEDRGDVEESKVGAASLPTFSDRIVYLLDFSGSIWNEQQEGKTRKQVLDPVFERTLDALKTGTWFNVGPYTGEIHPWQKALVEADAKRIKAAQEYLRDIKVTGPGDFYLAVQWAKQDPSIDTICVLTDGAPSGGRRWNMEAMAELLLRENQLRPLRFDVVLVDCPKGLQRHWRRLTEGSGGTLQALDLK